MKRLPKDDPIYTLGWIVQPVSTKHSSENTPARRMTLEEEHRMIWEEAQEQISSTYMSEKAEELGCSTGEENPD